MLKAQFDYVAEYLNYEGNVKNAIAAVIFSNMTCYSAEKRFGIAKSTLSKRVERFQLYVSFAEGFLKAGTPIDRKSEGGTPSTEKR